MSLVFDGKEKSFDEMMKELTKPQKFICEQGHILPDIYDECPICQSVVDEAIKCRVCGEYSFASETSYGWCPDCQDDLVDRFCRATREFDADERHLVFEFIDKNEWEIKGEDN